jgi:hypothetical protein
MLLKIGNPASPLMCCPLILDNAAGPRRLKFFLFKPPWAGHIRDLVSFHLGGHG